jgi:hypothetical protein
MDNTSIPVPLSHKTNGLADVSNNPSPGLVLDETIDDVDKSTNKLILTKHRNAAAAVIFGCIAWLVWIGYLIMSGGPLVKDDWRETTLFVPIVVVAVSYAMFRNKVLREFMQQFAMANSFTYAKYGDANQLQGALFNLGHGHKMENVVSGSFDGNTLNLFDYNYTIGSGKNSHTYSCTAAQIDYPSILAPILLVVDSQSFGGIVPFFSGWEKVKPEGNFDKTFDLYTKKEMEIEALQIFSPDFMLKMLQDWPEFNLEFNGSKITVFYNRTITKKAELQKMFDLIKYLIVRIEPQAQRMAGSVAAMQAVLK